MSIIEAIRHRCVVPVCRRHLEVSVIVGKLGGVVFAFFEVKTSFDRVIFVRLRQIVLSGVIPLLPKKCAAAAGEDIRLFHLRNTCQPVAIPQLRHHRALGCVRPVRIWIGCTSNAPCRL